VPDQANRITVLNQGIFARDFFVNRHQHLLFSDQLEEVTQLEALALDELAHGQGCGNFAGHIPLSISGLELPGQDNRHHVCARPLAQKVADEPMLALSVIDSAHVSVDNDKSMQSLDIHHPGMPDLQFVLFMSALCTSNIQTMNVPEELRRAVFDRCWALLHTEPPPTDPTQRVLDLRDGTELTLEACVATIRSLLTHAGITTVTWDHPVSEPTRDSTPSAKPLVDRLGQLYPGDPDLVDPQPPPPDKSRPN
jgi:hypothetical protein